MNKVKLTALAVEISKNGKTSHDDTMSHARYNESVYDQKTSTHNVINAT